MHRLQDAIATLINDSQREQRQHDQRRTELDPLEHLLEKEPATPMAAPRTTTSNSGTVPASSKPPTPSTPLPSHQQAAQT